MYTELLSKSRSNFFTVYRRRKQSLTRHSVSQIRVQPAGKLALFGGANRLTEVLFYQTTNAGRGTESDKASLRLAYLGYRNTSKVCFPYTVAIFTGNVSLPYEELHFLSPWRYLHGREVE